MGSAPWCTSPLPAWHILKQVGRLNIIVVTMGTVYIYILSVKFAYSAFLDCRCPFWPYWSHDDMQPGFTLNRKRSLVHAYGEHQVRVYRRFAVVGFSADPTYSIVRSNICMTVIFFLFSQFSFTRCD